MLLLENLEGVKDVCEWLSATTTRFDLDPLVVAEFTLELPVVPERAVVDVKLFERFGLLDVRARHKKLCDLECTSDDDRCYGDDELLVVYNPIFNREVLFFDVFPHVVLIYGFHHSPFKRVTGLVVRPLGLEPRTRGV